MPSLVAPHTSESFLAVPRKGAVLRCHGYDWQRSIAACCVCCDMTIPKAFAGLVTDVEVGGVRFNYVEAMRHRAVRSAVHDRNEAVMVNRVISGSVRVFQGGRTAVLHPGDLALHDASQPYELEFDDYFSQLIFQIPRSALRRRVGALEPFVATVVRADDPLGGIASNFLYDLARVAGSIDAAAAERLIGHAVDLVCDALCFSTAATARSSTRTTYRTALLYRVKAFVESHLGQELAVTGVAQATLGCSARYVEGLFADEETTFRHYVLERRLERCACDLTLRSDRRPISAVAYAWGFNSASHFCRAFRARYGVSPSGYRARARECAAGGED